MGLEEEYYEWLGKQKCYHRAFLVKIFYPTWVRVELCVLLARTLHDTPKLDKVFRRNDNFKVDWSDIENSSWSEQSICEECLHVSPEEVHVETFRQDDSRWLAALASARVGREREEVIVREIAESLASQFTIL